MPEMCKNVNMLARSVKLAGHCLTQWISKLPGSFEIHSVRQYLVKVVLCWVKNLETYEMTVKLRSNSVSPIFDIAK